MATIHIPEAEVARNFEALMAHARAGVDVVIENGALPVAVLSPAVPPHRTIEECIALLPEDSTATIDEDFARDVEAAIEAHRVPGSCFKNGFANSRRTPSGTKARRFLASIRHD